MISCSLRIRPCVRVWYRDWILRYMSGSRSSLVTMPSPSSSFWSLLVCKNGGEGLGDLVACVESVYRWEAVANENLEALPVRSCPRTWDQNVQIQHQDLRLISAKFVSYNDRTLPPVCLLSVIVRDQISQAFPFRFCTLQAIKNWSQGSSILANQVVQRCKLPKVVLVSARYGLGQLLISLVAVWIS